MENERKQILDQDWNILYARCVINDSTYAEVEKELQALAELGQTDAIMNWYEFHIVGDNPKIDAIVAESNDVFKFYVDATRQMADFGRERGEKLEQQKVVKSLQEKYSALANGSAKNHDEEVERLKIDIDRVVDENKRKHVFMPFIKATIDEVCFLNDEEKFYVCNGDAEIYLDFVNHLIETTAQIPYSTVLQNQLQGKPSKEKGLNL
ncbi:MAG: hypothetical protein E7375_03460 [Clostridiales bacterium]|nr:hypothetical protein [Clostridiales bacterium]